MKNILLISQSFAPRNAIASIRFTKVVKYLARTGEYHFWIICIGLNKGDVRDEILQRDIEEVAEYVTIFPVFMDKKLLKKAKNWIVKKKQEGKKDDEKIINPVQEKYAYYTVQKNFISCNQKGIIGSSRRLFGKMLVMANDIYDLRFEAMFARRGIGLIRRIPIDDIDVMISTHGNVGSLLLGLKFKRKRKQLKWVVDYRDPLRGESDIKKRYLMKTMYKADKAADYITGVANICIGSGKYMKKFREIPNSFDREDIRGFSTPNKNKKLRIVYTGTLYYGKSKLTLLFRIISELQNAGLIDKHRIEVVYAGKQFNTLLGQAEKYGLQDILVYEGMVSHKRALQLQHQADILCAATWNDEGGENVLTGKVLEYLMMERPIIVIVSGKKRDVAAMEKRKRLIDEAGLGCYLDVVGGRKNYEEAKQWFLEKYREYIEKGYIKNQSKRDMLERYSSAAMAQRFGKLIDACCDK